MDNTPGVGGQPCEALAVARDAGGRRLAHRANGAEQPTRLLEACGGLGLELGVRVRGRDRGRGRVRGRVRASVRLRV